MRAGPGETSTRALVLGAGAVLTVVLAFSRPVTDFFVALGRRGTQRLMRRSLSAQLVPVLNLSEDYQIVPLP